MSSNTRKLEIFYDYSCPYSRAAHEYLVLLLPDFPGTQPVWRPCEAHPRPHSSNKHQHSDLVIQAMFYAADHGSDLWKFHSLAYALMHDTDTDAEDIGSVSGAFSPLLDPNGLSEALTNGTYAQALHEANLYAFEHSGVWALPSLRLHGRKLDSVVEIGVTLEQLRGLLQSDV